MIDSLKPYPVTKDSGFQWLGKIPDHWQMSPAFAAYSPKQVKNTGMSEKTVLSLSYGQIVIKPVDKLHGLVPESFETYQIVDPDDIIVRTTDLQNDQTSLRVGFSKHRGIITSAYLCLKTRGSFSPEYGYLLLNAYDLLKILYGYGSGLRQNLDFSHIKRMPVPVPPPEEQEAIARFLEYADRRIRSYIRAKQRLIKLLEEQKQSIVHGAVTRGLDRSVRLRRSGIEWLGETPEHWELGALKRYSIRWCDGPFGSGLKSSHYTNEGVQVVRLQNIGYGRFQEREKAYISFQHYQTLGDHDVRTGDLLIAGLGEDRIPAGRACVAPQGIEPAMVKADCFRFRLKTNRLLPGFAAFQLSATAQLASAVLSTGATRQPINLSSSAGRIMSVPPISEQEAILKFLADATKPLDLAVERALNEIALIRELRTRLVACVVTGKLEVKQAPEQVPDGEQETNSEVDVNRLIDDEGIEVDVEESTKEAEG